MINPQARQLTMGFPEQTQAPKVKIVVYDTETGGLDPVRNPLLSIGAVAMNRDGEQTERFYTLVRPPVDLLCEASAMAVNGLHPQPEWPIERGALGDFLSFL